MAKNIGKIVQVIGPVVDIRYAAGQLSYIESLSGLSLTRTICQQKRRLKKHLLAVWISCSCICLPI